jgi:S-formylglutathione hydrolase FrmB
MISNKKFTVSYLIFLSSFWMIFSQVDTLNVYSQVMQKTIPNIVVTPENYSSTDEKRPVLFLLHGAGGDFSDWVTKAPIIRQLSNDLDFIIVCPDGGDTSWYFDSPIDHNMQYETYIAEELVDAIEKNYSVSSEKEQRAITGLSMGGHGALYLAFRHQDIWGAAGSMSGGVDIRSFPDNWNIAKRLGPISENKTLWDENSVINMLDLISEDLNLIIDCGYDDFFFNDNKRIHQELLNKGVGHVYIERPGAHNWDYWRNAIKYQLMHFKDFFQRN